MKSKVLGVKGLRKPSKADIKTNSELERELFENGTKKQKTMMDRGVLPMGTTPGIRF